MSWVLVIEDEEDISSFLRYILENEDLVVKTAGSLAEARAHLKGELGLPSAVLLDRGLPDGDGLDICRELKGAGPKPAVLVLSARKHPDEVSEGLAAGADHYITKPFQFMDVISRLPAAA
ncbi:MAG: response regulator transcription factor [Elusimicrobiota bacterium]|nr:MAG: response regulator transcription factor [Elusimicrobiota bacterium]